MNNASGFGKRNAAFTQSKPTEGSVTKNRGFTLIELIVTITIAAIVMGIAVPSFREIIRNNRTAAAANQLAGALALARSEAVKRGAQVTMRRTGSTAQAWEQGWEVFVDYNGNGAKDHDGDTINCEVDAQGVPTEDCLLRTYAPLTRGYTLRTGTNFGTFLAYSAAGSLTGLADAFRLCDDSADLSKARAIDVNAAGRFYTKTGTASCP